MVFLKACILGVSYRVRDKDFFSRKLSITVTLSNLVAPLSNPPKSEQQPGKVLEAGLSWESGKTVQLLSIHSSAGEQDSSSWPQLTHP